MTEILPFVFLGGLIETRDWPHNKLCVMWPNDPYIPKDAIHIPTTYLEGDTIKVDVEKMAEAAACIHNSVLLEEPILVHCYFGEERSPLTIVWYLMQYQGMGLIEAYQLIKERHPQTIPRIEWLPLSCFMDAMLLPREERESNP